MILFKTKIVHIGDEKITQHFAWIPVRCRSEDQESYEIIWLEKYNCHQVMGLFEWFTHYRTRIEK